MVLAHDGLDSGTEFDTWRCPLLVDRVSAGGPYQQSDAAQEDRWLDGRAQIDGPEPAVLLRATRVIVAVRDNRWGTWCGVVPCPDELETVVAS